MRTNELARVKAKLAKPLEAQTMAVGPNQLLTVEVPSLMSGTTMLQVQRCYVWRDVEFKTAAMSCPAGEGGLSIDYRDDAGETR